MTSQATPDAMPSLARDVLTFYAEALADVRFPDVDLASLESDAEALTIAQLELARAQAAVEACTEALTARAQRALAYARVYADGNAELCAKLAAIGRGGAASSTGSAEMQQARRRGRPRKVDADASLFSGVDEAGTRRPELLDIEGEHAA